jgi:hypothetical protein
MNTSNPTMPPNTSTVPSSSGRYDAAFWEKLWRASGIGFVVFFILAYFIYGDQPERGASPDTIVAFYANHRTRVLIATVLSGMAVLNLLWFAAALRATLASLGQDGWGAAVTTSSAIVGGFLLLLVTLGAVLAYSIAGAGNNALVSGLNDLAWAAAAVSSFPRAMLIMAGSFGLWRAKLISNTLFAVGVAMLVLVLLGGTTWASSGLWAPDGVYSRFVSPVIGLIWVVVVGQILLTRSPAARSSW